MQHQGDTITISHRNVQWQSGSSDCGLFAVAFATAICAGCDPASSVFDQTSMRQHLLPKPTNLSFFLEEGDKETYNGRVTHILHLQTTWLRRHNGTNATSGTIHSVWRSEESILRENDKRTITADIVDKDMYTHCIPCIRVHSWPLQSFLCLTSCTVMWPYLLLFKHDFERVMQVALHMVHILLTIIHVLGFQSSCTRIVYPYLIAFIDWYVLHHSKYLPTAK